MNRQLLVMRHGKSDWQHPVADFDRPLKKRGKLAAQRMGAWLQQNNLIPDYIVTSPAERARKTAEKMTKAMGLGVSHVHQDSRLYDARLKDVKAVLGDCPDTTQRILVVGHNPVFEELVQDLHAGRLAVPDDGKLLPTATLAVLEIAKPGSEWSLGCARLLSIHRPSDLPPDFPFNGLAGPEQRQRPAYYYTQSGAIPYRIAAGRLEILLITSSGNHHWGIPKGIVEPGLTPAASAAVEAFEEAGIKGTISEQMLGYYSVQKWSGTCTVQIYPLRVSDCIEDRSWEENHRQRKWLPVDQAAALVRQKELAPMFRAFSDLFRERGGDD